MGEACNIHDPLSRASIDGRYARGQRANCTQITIHNMLISPVECQEIVDQKTPHRSTIISHELKSLE